MRLRRPRARHRQPRRRTAEEPAARARLDAHAPARHHWVAPESRSPDEDLFMPHRRKRLRYRVVGIRADGSRDPRYSNLSQGNGASGQGRGHCLPNLQPRGRRGPEVGEGRTTALTYVANLVKLQRSCRWREKEGPSSLARTRAVPEASYLLCLRVLRRLHEKSISMIGARAEVKRSQIGVAR